MTTHGYDNDNPDRFERWFETFGAGDSRERRRYNCELTQPRNSEETTMLVTFETEAHANITMFGDVAVALLQLMGHSGTVPGALLAEDAPAALARLRAAVAEQPDAPLDPETPKTKDEDAQRHVSLAHRALPLIQLLEAAVARGKNVMWR